MSLHLHANFESASSERSDDTFTENVSDSERERVIVTDLLNVTSRRIADVVITF